MTDNELRSLLEKSPETVHRTVFDKYCNYVYAIAVSKLKVCGRREDIEECVSDIFAEVFRSLDNKISYKGDLKYFIGTVAKRRAVDFYRKLSSGFGRTVSIEEESVDELPSDMSVEENAEKKELNRILISKIKELGEPDSSIIIQHYFYGRTAKEIAGSISMAENTVHKHLSRAREKLKTLLINDGICL